MLIEYDQSRNISAKEMVRSLAASTRRAVEESKIENQERLQEVERELVKLKAAQSKPAVISTDKHYTHNQTTSSAEWRITHNLDKFPAVEVVDSAGTAVIGDVTYIDTNTVVVKFKSQFKGKAYLN